MIRYIFFFFPKKSLLKASKKLVEPFQKKCLSWKRGGSGPRTLFDVPAWAEKERKYGSEGPHKILFITKSCSAMMCICCVIPGKISVFLREKLSPSRGLFLHSIKIHLVQHEIQTGSDTKILRTDAMKAKRYLSHISDKSQIDNQIVILCKIRRSYDILFLLEASKCHFRIWWLPRSMDSHLIAKTQYVVFPVPQKRILTDFFSCLAPVQI